MKATFNGAMRIYNSGWCDVSHTNEKEEIVEKFGVPEAEVDKMISLVWEIYEENDDAAPLDDGEN